MNVPVVPGDGRVACQHCYARVRLTPVPTLGMVWVDPDALGGGVICMPGIAHKPMPRVRADR